MSFAADDLPECTLCFTTMIHKMVVFPIKVVLTCKKLSLIVKSNYINTALQTAAILIMSGGVKGGLKTIKSRTENEASLFLSSHLH